MPDPINIIIDFPDPIIGKVVVPQSPEFTSLLSFPNPVVEKIEVPQTPQISSLVINIGPAGKDGSGGGVNLIVDEFLVSNSYVFNLTHIPVLSSISVYVNGLRQIGQPYSVMGNVLTLNSANAANGDTVSIEYGY